MIEIDQVEQSFLLQGLNLVLEQYEKELKLNPHDQVYQHFVQRINALNSKLPGLATGYVFMLPDEYFSLQTKPGDIERMSIQCICGTRFAVSLDRAVCPNCNMTHEVL